MGTVQPDDPRLLSFSITETRGKEGKMGGEYGFKVVHAGTTSFSNDLNAVANKVISEKGSLQEKKLRFFNEELDRKGLSNQLSPETRQKINRILGIVERAQTEGMFSVKVEKPVTLFDNGSFTVTDMRGQEHKLDAKSLHKYINGLIDGIKQGEGEKAGEIRSLLRTLKATKGLDFEPGSYEKRLDKALRR